MISYKKLFLIMEEREITKEKLKKEIGLSSATMAKLAKNEDLAMSTIQSLCNYFDRLPQRKRAWGERQGPQTSPT